MYTMIYDISIVTFLINQNYKFSVIKLIILKVNENSEACLINVPTTYYNILEKILT